MTPQEIKLPTFPRYAKDESGNTLFKFLSPFHCAAIRNDGSEFDITEDSDYDRTVYEWRQFLDEKYTEVAPEEFEAARSLAIQKLSEL